MERQVVFVKRFSDISSLQCAHKLTYFIIWSEVGLPYGIGIEREGADGSCEEFATHLLSKRQAAEELALFLYEQAVAPEHLFDILRDCKISNAL